MVICDFHFLNFTGVKSILSLSGFDPSLILTWRSRVSWVTRFAVTGLWHRAIAGSILACALTAMSMISFFFSRIFFPPVARARSERRSLLPSLLSLSPSSPWVVLSDGCCVHGRVYVTSDLRQGPSVCSDWSFNFLYELVGEQAADELFAVAIVVEVQVCVLEVLAYSCKLSRMRHVLPLEMSITERVDVWNVTKVYFVYIAREESKHSIYLSLIHIWRCRRSTLCRSRWSPYH